MSADSEWHGEPHTLTPEGVPMLGMTSGETFIFLIVAVLSAAAVLSPFAQAAGRKNDRIHIKPPGGGAP